MCSCCLSSSMSCPQLYPNNSRPQAPSPPPPPPGVDKDKAMAAAKAIFEANKRCWLSELRDGMQKKKDPKEGWDSGLLAKLLYDD